MTRWIPALLWAVACSPTDDTDGAPSDTDVVDTDPGDTDVADTDTDVADTDTDTDEVPDDSGDTALVATPFAVRVVSFTPGEAAGFGAEAMPGIVLGQPHGRGPSAGSLDVVSLGRGGEIVLELGVEVIDGPGVDLLVFENAFPGFPEPGHVAVSADGSAWHAWACDAEDAEGDYPGCAGVTPVLAQPGGPDATDAEVAGGDGFDLADLPIDRARYVRIVDADATISWYTGTTGGFDLDAVAVVHAAP